MSKKEGIASARSVKIPATAASQFPDNIHRPFWSIKEDPSSSDDFFDCYVAFKEFGCHEYLWEWNDRKIDSLLFRKLTRAYGPFFDGKPIGKKCFITFRVSADQPVESLGRLYMSIITADSFAKDKKMSSPPLFEVSHALASADDLIRFTRLYNETVGMACDSLDRDCGPKVISMIPEHNFRVNWFAMLKNYMDRFSGSFRRGVDYVRPLISRSSIADSLGFVASVLATKRALAGYAAFTRITGIDSYPVVEAGPLMFRGGLSPSTTENFIQAFPGTRTAVVSSAFRYGYPVEQVKESFALLNRKLPKNSAESFSKEDSGKMNLIENVFAKHFRNNYRMLPDFSDIVSNMLKRIDFPNRLHKSFSLYSLGIPPEFIGTGSAILECIREGLIRDLEKFYPSIKKDLVTAGRLLNKENLSFLAKTGKIWEKIARDVRLVEEYTDTSLGPESSHEFMHRNHTSNIFHLRSRDSEFSEDLVLAAKLRHCLG